MIDLALGPSFGTLRGLGVLGWALKDVALPTIDTSAAWIPVAVLGVVPLSFMLAIAASRLLPRRGIPLSQRLFAF